MYGKTNIESKKKKNSICNMGSNLHIYPSTQIEEKYHRFA